MLLHGGGVLRPHAAAFQSEHKEDFVVARLLQRLSDGLSRLSDEAKF